jgi:hypothetical protein
MCAGAPRPYADHAEITIAYDRGGAPENAGVRPHARRIEFPWIPAFAGMTEWWNFEREYVAVFAPWNT